MMLTIWILLIVSYLSSVNCGCVDQPPDGTGTALFFTECNTGTPHTLKILSISALNPDGSTDYPLSFTNVVKVQGTLMNAGPEIDDLHASMSVYMWKDYLLKCKWHTLPTFGLLGNLDVCRAQAGFNCPWPANIQQYSVEANINLTSYSSIISSVLGNTIYKLDITFKSTSGSELGCVTIEAKLQ